MRKTTALTLLGTLAVLSVVITPLIVAIALPATEVERVKDYYYFRIHGQNIQNLGSEAQFVYRNLSPGEQDVLIIVDGIRFPIDDLESGGEFPSAVFAGAGGVEIDFTVEIDGVPAWELDGSGSIWIPPGNN
jgi:hypothetical protein